MEAKLLCVGDMHLGRRPRGIPAGRGFEADALTPAAAWRRVIDLALAQEVDAVLLAGDVVESQNRFFEAFGPLETGVRELVRAGVQVIGVAGNHDVEVLPRLADEIEGFHLLGRGGKWEAIDIAREGRTLARIVGWSFPERVVSRDPLESFDLVIDKSVPVLGLLHCELDAATSSYAPVGRRALEARELDAWLLGHVHKPTLAEHAHSIGYLGSLQGLDVAETGPHGPWLARAYAPGKVEFEHLPIAPLRWEEVDVALDDLDRIEELESRIVRAIGALHTRLEHERSPAEVVGCRLRVVGRTHHGVRLRRALAELDTGELVRELGTRRYFIDRLSDELEPAIDLSALARRDDPPGLLAKRLVAIQSDARHPDTEPFMREARQALRPVADQSAWQALGEPDADDALVRARILRVGLRALEELLAQTSA